MLRKLMIVILAGVFFCGFFSSNIAAETFEKLTPNKIPLDQIAASSPTPLTGDKGFCLIQSDNDNVAWFYDGFLAGDGFALYLDPAKCGLPDPYPFKITDVLFYDLDTNSNWPAEIQVNIRDLVEGDKCNKPGSTLCSQTFMIPIDSSAQSLGGPMNLTIDPLCCVYGPFFLEIKYTGGTDPPYPALLMTNATTNPTDTCDAWYYWEQHSDYSEWYDTWTLPIPGYPIMRITGYTQQCHPESCWYWKDSTENSPSGMPDFDQYQFGPPDSLALCGPAAVTNCLWWFDAVPPGMEDPGDLIRLLSDYFKTDPAFGTWVDSIQAGLEEYFSDFEFALQESTFEKPDFHEMEDSLKRSQDIILLLGFYWSEDGVQWYREGGHFVTMAGVCSDSLKIAVSDPAGDGAVQGAPGRFKPAEHPPSGQYDATLHNDPTYVSHDMYDSDLAPDPPSPGNPHWEINYPYSGPRYSGMNVPEKFKAITRPAPKGAQFVATEVEFAVMICPKPTAVDDEEGTAITPKDFELYQSYPNPFNNQTIIKYNLLKSCQVTLTIYNILGQKVRTLVKERQKAGSNIVNWDGKDEKGKDVASGIYFYQLKAGEVTQTKRMVLLK